MGDIGAALADVWRSVLHFIPKAVALLAIVAVGLIVAMALRKVVRKALGRVGFDRLVRRGGVGRTLARNRYEASDLMGRLASYAVLLVALQIGFGVWGPNPVSALLTSVVLWLPRGFVAILLIVVATAIAGAVRDVISGTLSGLSYGRIVARLASWSIIGLGAIAALNQVGIATTVTTPVLIAALAAVVGVLVVGVGGGLVRPMSHRWDRWLDRAETEAESHRERQAHLAGRDDLGRQMADRLARSAAPPMGAEPTGVLVGGAGQSTMGGRDGSDPRWDHSTGSPGSGHLPEGWEEAESASTTYRSGSAAGSTEPWIAVEPPVGGDPEDRPER